jgi:hypothetical protein
VIDEVFINTALHLWAFEISELPSAPIDVHAFTDTMNTRPLPFEAKFEHRINEADYYDRIWPSWGLEQAASLSLDIIFLLFVFYAIPRPAFVFKENYFHPEPTHPAWQVVDLSDRQCRDVAQLEVLQR